MDNFFHPTSHANMSGVYNFQEIFFEGLFTITYSNIKTCFLCKFLLLQNNLFKEDSMKLLETSFVKKKLN
jgi:hypothetical protein